MQYPKQVRALALAGMLAATHCAFSQASQSDRRQLFGIENALRTGDFAQAVQLSQAALEKSPRDYRLWTLRGMALSGAQKPALALAAYRHAAQLAPNYLPALEGAAQIEFQQGSGNARTLVERVLAIDPKNATAHSMLAMIAYRAHDCHEALRHFQQAGAAIDSQAGALMIDGYCLTSMGRFDEAIPILTRVVALAPNLAASYNLALAQWNAGHPEDALKTLQPLIDAGTSDEDTLTLAADIEESANNTAKAIELLRAAILANPKEVRGYLQFTTLSSNHKSYQVGIDMLNAGLTQNPGSAQLYLARGILHAQMGDLSNAMDDFETARRSDPALSFLGTAEGVAETQRNKLDEALAKFRAEATKHPDDALTQYLLAETLSAYGKPEGSPAYREEIAAASRALKLDPKLVGAYDLLAGLYLQSGKIDLAIGQSEAALRIDSGDQQALYHLILAFRKTDRKGEIPGLTQRLIALRDADHAKAAYVYQLVEAPRGRP
jgi:tetratricopeptide (TPR) repeat protein